MKGIMSLTEARKKIFQISDTVQKSDNYYLITENGKAKIAILSATDLESFLETIEVLRDCPKAFESFDAAKKAVLNGEYKKFKTIEEIAGKYTKQLKKNNVSSKSSAKSRKTTR